MQQHIVKIIYNGILCATLIKRNIKRVCAELSCQCLEGVHFNSLNIFHLATVHIVKTYCYLIMSMYLDTSSGKFYTLPYCLLRYSEKNINIKQLDKEFAISFLIKYSRDEDFNVLFNF